MIKLDVKDYCHDCIKFNPIAIDNRMGGYAMNGKEMIFGDVLVKCENWEQCEAIEKHFSKMALRDLQTLR